jgi:hypothetical protein
VTSKYGTIKTVVDNITFDSIKEARRYGELKELEKQGKIKNLTIHPKFLLQDKFKHKGKTHKKITYSADFQYEENGDIVVEDVKGYKTDVYRMKMKMFLFRYGDKCEFKET